MESSNQQESRKSAAKLIVLLDRRIAALERKLAAAETDATRSAGTVESAPGVENRVAALAAEAASQRDELRNLHKELVNRVADVDDDRRRTASTLQRALDSHQDAVTARMRRHGTLMTLLAFLAVLLAIAAAWLGLHRTATDNARVSAEIAELKEEMSGVSLTSGDEELLGEKLPGLTETVSEISTSLEKLVSEQTQAQESREASSDRERMERKEADAGLDQRLGGLEADVEALSGEVVSLRAELAKVAALASAKPERTPVSRPETDPGEVSVPEQIPEVENGPSPAPAFETSDLPKSESAVQSARESREGPEEEAVADPTPAPAAWPESEPERAGASSASEDEATAVAEDETALIIHDRRHVLQLIGFYSLDRLREFADRDDLPDQVYFRRETLRGRPWYVLIHSLHADQASAVAARSSLPADLAALDVWIRNLAEGERVELLAPEQKKPR
jgi:DamX protein